MKVLRVNLIGDTLPILLDKRTAELGGSFYFEPLRVYAPVPHRWAWEQLQAFPKAVMLDVGSHTGCYALLAAHHPDLTVFAFEPVPLTAEVLRENVRLNDLEDRVEVVEAGVSNYNGDGVVHAVRQPGGSGISIVNGTPAAHKDCIRLPVEVMTIDRFCEDWDIQPTLIKIDVEGGERLALEGAAQTISRYHPIIITEYSAENTAQYGYNPDAITQFLDRAGYTYLNPEGSDLLATWKDRS